MGDRATNGQTRHAYGDEVDVLEVLRVLWRRKVLLFMACVLGMAVAGTYLAIMPVEYHAQQTLIMQVGNAVSPERQASNEIILLMTDIPDMIKSYTQKQGQETPEADLITMEVAIIRQAPFELQVTASGENLEVITEFLSGLPDYLAQDERIALTMEHLRHSIRRELEADAKMLEQYTALLERLHSSKDMVIVGFDVIAARNNVHMRMVRNLEDLETLEVTNFFSWVEPEPVSTEIRPQTWRALFLTVFASLVAGVFLVFLWEARAQRPLGRLTSPSRGQTKPTC